MEALAGIEADIESYFGEQDQQKSSSDGCKQVPWLSWEEWDSVRESLFSSSPDRIASALERVATWRSRGSLPAPVDVTCSLIEIQLKDGFIPREKQSADALYSEHLLQMLYCMGILRLVNCVIEKTRRREDVSIADAARAIGIPRKLIDIRHEGSHRELPALSVLRDAADEALEWLKSYYWEPQKFQIPLKRDGTASIRREVKSKLRKLALSLQLKKSPQFDSPLVKEKCSNKRIRKIVSSLVELYPSFSAEISSVLLEFLLKALDSSKSTELQNQPGQDFRVFLDEWKPVIMEFSNREPELLLTLLKAVLDMIQNNERRRYETEKSVEEVSQVEQVPFLFAWLVSLLNGSKHFQRNSSLEVKPPSTFLMELIRRCLLLGALGYKLVFKSAFLLAEIVGGRVLKEKLIKLPLMHESSASVLLEQSSTLVTAPTTLLEREKNLDNAGKRLEFVKLQLSKKKGIDTDKTTNRWRKAKTWSPCPIGMLPRIIGSSGRLPLLDCQNAQSISKQAQGNNNAKRGADECNRQQLENSTFKRAKKGAEDSESNDVTPLETYMEEAEIDIEHAYDNTETEADENLMWKDEEESRSCLMIGGEWKRVNDGELVGMASSVTICV
ncbi:PREDICTED: uncharacterized protein LOC104769459 [Camelina sativa]|uniref:Uncharacterized protein LOC104769459 n=1 Tax=Camelina sativa TaxID=90675 RepID=A0ABM0XWE6_CAMSA|nr:PREDICTED: uncharacterized protein LOC104769459 [Camelina sativa]